MSLCTGANETNWLDKGSACTQDDRMDGIRCQDDGADSGDDNGDEGHRSEKGGEEGGPNDGVGRE